MVLSLFSHLKSRASHLTFNSVLYNWSLGGFFGRGDVPDRLVVRPVDVWPGDAEAGARLCGGVFSLGAEELQLRGTCWEPFGVSDAWMAHMHGFSWLRDLRSLAEQGGKAKSEDCRVQARMMILAWIDRYRGWSAMSWRADITGERLAMWISLYEFFSHDCLDGACDEEFHDLFFESLGRQGVHLSRAIVAEELQGIGLLKAAKGLLYAGLAFEGRELWVEQALDILEDEAERQILGDGAHVSRGAGQLLEALQIYVDVRSALRCGGYPLPESIQHVIDRMGPAVRFYRYNDKGFAVFNGAQTGDGAFVDCVLAQTGAKGKILESLPCAGYERVQLGRSLLMFDCGNSPPRPFDVRAHGAPLAFELSYGRERLFVNCGSHPYDGEWQEALKATAAHNTVVLGNRNACEIGQGGHMTRRVRKVSAMREDTKDACLLDATHDGYESLNGFKHRRRLYLSGDGYDLRGEDILQAAIIPARGIEAAVRFHLHPRVNVSLINGGAEALLRLPSGLGWRFKHVGGILALEDSVYMGAGVVPRKTKQLAIYGQITDKHAQIKWGLHREG